MHYFECKSIFVTAVIFVSLLCQRRGVEPVPSNAAGNHLSIGTSLLDVIPAHPTGHDLYQAAAAYRHAIIHGRDPKHAAALTAIFESAIRADLQQADAPTFSAEPDAILVNSIRS